MLLAPLTTVPILGLLVAANLLVENARLPALVAAVVVVGGAALYSRAMHLDGLADTADGLSATGDTDARLAAMKASDVGPSGVAVLVLVLLLQVACVTALVGTWAGTTMAAIAWVTSRLAIAWCCRPGVPAASSTGLGAMVAGSVLSGRTGREHSDTCWSSRPWRLGRRHGWWTGPVVVVAGLLGAAGLLHRCLHRFGGVTGDVLGAVVETALAAALLAAVLLSAWAGAA